MATAQESLSVVRQAVRAWDSMDPLASASQAATTVLALGAATMRQAGAVEFLMTNGSPLAAHANARAAFEASWACLMTAHDPTVAIDREERARNQTMHLENGVVRRLRERHDGYPALALDQWPDLPARPDGINAYRRPSTSWERFEGHTETEEVTYHYLSQVTHPSSFLVACFLPPNGDRMDVSRREEVDGKLPAAVAAMSCVRAFQALSVVGVPFDDLRQRWIARSTERLGMPEAYVIGPRKQEKKKEASA